MSVSTNNINPNDRFEICSIIGDTLQGRIYRGVDKLSNKFVAIKETWKILVKLNQCRQGTKIRENYLNEINLLKYLSTSPDCPPSIIRLISSWEESQCYMYAMEYCDCCLFNYMKKIHEKGHMKIYCDTMKKLPQRTMNYRESIKNPFLHYVQKIFIKLTHCISYLHNKNIVHLDLSLENIMLNDLNDPNNDHISNPSIKIIDFGLSKYFGETATNFTLIDRCGKTAYMAPEVYEENKLYDGRAADIWSLGIILFVMLIGTHLIDKPTLNDQRFYYLMKKKGVAPLLTYWRRLRLINDDVLDLMNKIFQYEPHRINMKQLLNHPFLDPDRYSVDDNNANNDNDTTDDAEISMYEPTPTPSSTGETIPNDDIVIIDDDDDDDDDDDEKSVFTENTDNTDDDTLSYPSIRGFDFEQEVDQQINNNHDQNSQNQNQNQNKKDKMNIDAIPARVQSKTSISEPDEFINPRIGRDGMFVFGIFKNKNDIIQKYEF